ncbi:MAG TPA: hypothetical protein VFR18_25430 [Terriglobia bacterium]|nr:hypothetical protein [Terriglobia bacterium]
MRCWFHVGVSRSSRTSLAGAGTQARSAFIILGTPRKVGELAKAAEVKRVVITHFAPNQGRNRLPGDVQLAATSGATSG